MIVLDLSVLKARLESFPAEHDDDFNEFWLWKTRVESDDRHILDDAHREMTYDKLSKTLRTWQAYRNSQNSSPYETLREALRNISPSYDAIRGYTLIELDEAPMESLKRIWHELGRVKEREGKGNEGDIYYVMAVCKPLMFLWGQTMAFDTKVRRHCPSCLGVKPNEYRWTFDKWRGVMDEFRIFLNDNRDCAELLREESERRYGEDAPIPYGRLLDIHYFMGP